MTLKITIVFYNAYEYVYIISINVEVNSQHTEIRNKNRLIFKSLKNIIKTSKK